MNFLMDKLPDHIIIDGRKYPINADFRAVILYSRLISEDSGAGENLGEAMSVLFRGECPPRTEEAIQAINLYVAGGRTRKQGPSKKLLGLNEDLPFDFEEDDRLIWSAFFCTYRINLRTIEFLHWWEFLELLEELPEDCRLERTIHYRTVDVNNPKLGKDQKTVLKAIQNSVKIRPKRTQEYEDFTQALREGRDPFERKD